MKTKILSTLKSVAVFTFLLFIAIQTNAQADLIKKNLDKWRNDYPQEKIFLQTDKSYYVGGEDIWMKTWCTTIDGPTFLSRIVYLDIVEQLFYKCLYPMDAKLSCVYFQKEYFYLWERL